MRENINKVSQRGERLDSLQDKTDNLATSAQGFRRGANRVRKQMWWKGQISSPTRTIIMQCQLISYCRHEDANLHHRGNHYIALGYHHPLG